MPTTRRRFLAAVALTSFTVPAWGQQGIEIQVGRPPRAGEVAPAIPDEAALLKACNLGELVFVGKVIKTNHSPAVGLSDPPLHSMTIEFSDAERLRGTLPEKPVVRYSVRANVPPTFLAESRQLVVANRPDGKTWTVAAIVPATDPQIALAKKAVALPIGWTLVDGKPLSPWAERGVAWPGGKPGADGACSKTGRPVLLAGPGIEIKVEQVLPENRQEFKNPFGDGEFKITVTNTGKEAVVVPALLARGDEVQWPASIVAVQGSKAYAFPLPAGEGELKPKKLAAGESVSGVVNTLQLGDGVSWPRGGSRIHFTFALGDVSAGNFFYYFSALHDKMREKKK